MIRYNIKQKYVNTLKIVQFAGRLHKLILENPSLINYKHWHYTQDK